MQLDLKPINHSSYWPMIGFRRHVRAALILARAQWSWMWRFIVLDGQRAVCGLWHAARRDGCVQWLLYPSIRVRIRHLIFHRTAVQHHPLLLESALDLVPWSFSNVSAFLKQWFGGVLSAIFLLLKDGHDAHRHLIKCLWVWLWRLYNAQPIGAQYDLMIMCTK